MKRDALAAFFRRAVVAALPFASTACGAPGGQQQTPPPTQICDGGFFTRDLTPTCMTGGGGFTVQVLDGGPGDGGCESRCGAGAFTTCSEERNSDCEPIVVCEIGCIGRAPDGLAPAQAQGGALGRYFAGAAHLEAASVAAFRRLRAELRSLGAPRALRDACTTAASDEVRHARSAARLARRFGSTPPPVRLDAPRARSLMALAIENAREGCVGETFGALMATWQLGAAADADVRAHFASTLGDETRHAELAWSIDAWLRTRVTAAERAHLDAVRSDALARLALALDAAPAEELERVAGLPTPPVARALLRAFADEVARRA